MIKLVISMHSRQQELYIIFTAFKISNVLNLKFMNITHIFIDTQITHIYTGKPINTKLKVFALYTQSM